jgi:hypothetical protein
MKIILIMNIFLMIIDYMVYDNDLYEINNNGTLEKSGKNREELITQITKERNLRFITEDDLINSIIQDLPGTMQINEDYPHPRLINKNTVHPLKIYDFLYEVRLKSFEDDETYVALYNASKNIWAIPPIKGYGEFMETEYEDWIYYWKVGTFYNIKTRKKYSHLYSRNSLYIFDNSMIYQGYNNLRDEAIIENF